MERTEAEAFVVYPRVLRVARASPMSGCPPENSIAPESVSSDEKNAHRRRAAAQKKI